MKVAVIGANGQLGKDICEAFLSNGDQVLELDIERKGSQWIDIADIESVSKALKGCGDCDMVINTAAMHNVEACENDPEKAFKVNGVGSINLSLVCNEIDKPLLHISTDYVFDGHKQKPYDESDKPLPLNVYGNTKLSGEHFIESMAKKYFILRVSGIYGKNPCLAKGGRNFVDLMLKLAGERDEVRVVDDEVLTPTFTEDIAAQVVRLAHSGEARYGLYHCTAEGCCSWYEFAKEIFTLAKSDVTLNKAAPGEFAVKVNRPKYSVLENKFLKDQKLNIMPPWQEGLKRYLKIKYNI